MANEKRLIDAYEAMEYAQKVFSDPVLLYAIKTVLDNTPTVDAVEVVRCRDCYHDERCICVCCEDGEMVLCGLHHKHMDANGFCSEGWKAMNEEVRV